MGRQIFLYHEKALIVEVFVPVKEKSGIRKEGKKGKRKRGGGRRNVGSIVGTYNKNRRKALFRMTFPDLLNLNDFVDPPKADECDEEGDASESAELADEDEGIASSRSSTRGPRSTINTLAFCNYLAACTENCFADSE